MTSAKAGSKPSWSSPRCSLKAAFLELISAHGKQVRIAPKSTAVSTSTRNFPNRFGQGANVYLSSAEVATVAAVLGRLPSVEEYMAYATKIDSMAPEIYRYMNFDQMPEFVESAKRGQEVVLKLAI